VDGRSNAASCTSSQGHPADKGPRDRPGSLLSQEELRDYCRLVTKV